jgi:uroporphyrinogen decarboxylase
MQPLRRLDVDAAILFSDLLLPLGPMGLEFDFIKGEGPSIDRPIRSEADIMRLRVFDPRSDLAHVQDTIRLVQGELDRRLPLIGFGGAPFTLASYAIEGGHSANFAQTKSLMYGHSKAWHRLCEKLAAVVSDCLLAQIEAGADAIQLFDSWVGVLDARDYREFALPHTRRIFEALEPTGVPLIHFGTGTASILGELREAGGDVIGVDWRIGLDEAWERIGHDRAVQGNLDPTLLFAPMDRLLAGADDVLRRVNGRPGHIFNLGHGILPGVPVEHVQALARHVHQRSRALGQERA